MTSVHPVLADFVQEGLGSWWAPGLAFAAGIVSFASPCVFPLVPGYLSFVSGEVGVEVRERAPLRRTLLPVGLFVAGFATVFTLLGAFSGTISRAIRSTTGTRIAGGIMIAFGIVMVLYALQWGRPSWYAERRPLLRWARPGPAWAFPLGVAFGAGWAPCIGPVLGGVLAIAASQGGAARGALLLATYSLGLGLPFLLVGLGVRGLGGLDAIRRNYHWIAGVSGGVMITIGVLIVTGAWVRLLAPLLRLINQFETPL